MLHDLCIGKTGTMTKGRMNVSEYQLGQPEGEFVFIYNREAEPQSFADSNISEDLKELVKSCIIMNTDVRIEHDDDQFMYEPKGQPLEVGMVQFLLENEYNVPDELITRELYARKVAQIPFDQNLKRMTVVRQIPNNAYEDQVRIVVKGAPEYVIPCCVETIDLNFNRVQLTEED